MSEQDPPRLSEISSSEGDAENDFLRDAIRDSKRDLPDETRLAAIALKLGPGILGGAAAAGGGGGGAAAGGAGAAKASVAPAAAKIGAMSASMKFATAVAVTVAIGGGAIVVPRIISPTTSAVTVAPTTNSTSSAIASSSAINLALPPASASAAPPFPSMKPLVIPPRNPDEETKALEQAQDALNTDPDYALAQCDDDAKLFPNGTLAQEREVVAIDALTRLGRMPEAKARAKKFATAYPNSAHLWQVQKLVGQK
jgi:hypothetical protein